MCTDFKTTIINVLTADTLINIGALKVGVHLKAVFTSLKIGLMEISRLHFKQYKNPLLIDHRSMFWGVL